MRFEKMGLRDQTVDALKDMGYLSPTEVQEKIIPTIINGENVIARSKTGTGKTAAFGIGIVERLMGGTANKALVLTPTRELTLQVSKELRKIAANYSLNIVEVYGGYSINMQIQNLKKGVDILVATPGRLLDHTQRRTVDLSEYDLVVLDEADRMLDMGFRDEMDRVMKQTPDERSVLLLSATIDNEILGAASRYMKNHVIIEVGEKEKPAEINEEYMELTKSKKLPTLVDILRNTEGRAIVFTSTKVFANRLADLLRKRGFNSDSIQGDMSQAAREKVLSSFSKGELKVLVATDVAARGLHIDDVGLIVNYDRAEDDDTHLHRVGRTGRMGSAGRAVTFVERKETLDERFREDHPDFAWMKGGASRGVRGDQRRRRIPPGRPGKKQKKDKK
jgi:ATP-dependent RNA helicase DeaD